MRIGINWISPTTLPVIRELHRQGLVDFCEIMADNFVHLPPDEIKQALADIPISLHIVTSRFLEKSPAELELLAQHLRPWIKALQPFYVSDHLIQMYSPRRDARQLPLLAELDYERDYASIKKRVMQWQELLDTKILFENHASLTARGKNQAGFFADLMEDTDAELLFDFSNAYIAEHNGVAPALAWDTLINKSQHFHVAGFRLDKVTNLALDTHDQPIAEPVLKLMSTYLSTAQNKTLVMEYNAKATFEKWRDEIQRVKYAVSGTGENYFAYREDNKLVSAADESIQSALALQNLQQSIFHHTPQLLALSHDHDKDIFTPFLHWADENNVIFNWTTHIHLLNWLCQQTNWRVSINVNIIKELLIATVTRWSLSGMEHAAAQGIMLVSKHLPGIAVGLWKSREAGTPGKVVLISLAEKQHPIEDCFALAYQFGTWENVEWETLMCSHA